MIELPWIRLSFKSRCPVCREIMAGHLVKPRFRCPFCARPLQSNRGRAMTAAILLGLLVFALLLGWLCFGAWHKLRVVREDL